MRKIATLKLWLFFLKDIFFYQPVNKLLGYQ